MNWRTAAALPSPPSQGGPGRGGGVVPRAQGGWRERALQAALADPRLGVLEPTVAFAIFSVVSQTCALARSLRNENEIFTMSFAKPCVRRLSDYFAAIGSQLFSFEIWWQVLLANSRGASEFAFALAAVSLQPRCTQTPPPTTADRPALPQTCQIGFLYIYGTDPLGAQNFVMLGRLAAPN